MEMRRRAPVDGRTALRQEMADVFRIHDVGTGRCVGLLRHSRAVRHDDFTGVDQQRRAVGENVERALSAAAVDEMDVETSVGPLQKGLADFCFGSLGFLRRYFIVQVVLPGHFCSLLAACCGSDGGERAEDDDGLIHVFRCFGVGVCNGTGRRPVLRCRSCRCRRACRRNTPFRPGRPG